MDSSTGNENRIVIHLGQQHNTIFPSESLFQKDLYAKLSRTLDDQWQRLVKRRTSVDGGAATRIDPISTCRTHNTILIMGERGCGKTVFLSNVQSCLASSNAASHFQFLDTIDPSLLSNTSAFSGCESFCAVLIGHLHSYLQQENKIDDSKQEAYCAIFREVAAHLSSIKNADAESGMDAIYEHVSALALEESLHRYFSFVGREILSGKMICFLLDDIDMAFQPGYFILETIRKYFSSPWVLFIACGDERLYGQIVLREISSNLKLADSIREDPRSFPLHESSFSKSSSLTQKYLEKIFPCDLRFTMKNLTELIENHSIVFSVDDNRSASLSVKQIDDFIHQMFNRGIRNHQNRDHALDSWIPGEIEHHSTRLRDSLRRWSQFHEKMAPLYRLGDSYKTQENFGKTYQTFQQNLVDFFRNDADFSYISRHASANLSCFSIKDHGYSFDYDRMIQMLSSSESSGAPDDPGNLWEFHSALPDYSVNLYLAIDVCRQYLENNPTSISDETAFLLQLFTSLHCFQENDETCASVLSGRFIRFLFTTLADDSRSRAVEKIFLKEASFSSLSISDDASFPAPRTDWTFPGNIWEKIQKNALNGCPSSKLPFFDGAFLRIVLSRYFTELVEIRDRLQEKKDTLFHFMKQCVCILLAADGVCELETSPFRTLLKNVENCPEKVFPDPSYIGWHIFHHPVVQTILKVHRYYAENPVPAEQNLFTLQIRRGTPASPEENNQKIRKCFENAKTLNDINRNLSRLAPDELEYVRRNLHKCKAFEHIVELYSASDSQTMKNTFQRICNRLMINNLNPQGPTFIKKMESMNA